MSARLPARALLAPAAVAVAVVVGGSLQLSTAALADEPGARRSDQGAGHRATPTPSPQGDANRADPSAPSGRPTDLPTPADPHGKRSGGTDEGTSGGSDPAGNNGTITIDYPTGDSGHANRPHPGCGFQLRMFGFDDDQWGTLTVTGQAPTPGGTLLSRHLLLSDDAAGGGQDVDKTYALTTGDLGLTGEPTSAQGWHLKVAVKADGAPGGAKQKVLWLDCEPAQRTESGSSSVVRPALAPLRESARLITSELIEERSVAQPTPVRATGTGGRLFGAALPLTGLPLALLLVGAAASILVGVMALLTGRRRGSAVDLGA